MSEETEKSSNTAEIAAKLVLLQSEGDEDVVGQRMPVSSALQFVTLLSDEKLAAFIDGRLQGAERSYVIGVLASHEEYRNIWLENI